MMTSNIKSTAANSNAKGEVAFRLFSSGLTNIDAVCLVLRKHPNGAPRPRAKANEIGAGPICEECAESIEQ